MSTHDITSTSLLKQLRRRFTDPRRRVLTTGPEGHEPEPGSTTKVMGGT